MPKKPNPTEEILHGVRTAIEHEIDQYVRSSEGSVYRFADSISTRLAAAADSEDLELFEELLAQIRVLAELERIRANELGWAITQAVVSGILKVAIVALRAVAL